MRSSSASWRERADGAGGASKANARCTGVAIRGCRRHRESAVRHDFYTHDGLRLEAYFYKAAGAGPFPLVIYNHGSRVGSERTETPGLFIGRMLTGAGYAVLVPERRGYGKSDGPTGHLIFGRFGADHWSKDVLAFLAKHMRAGGATGVP